MREMQDSCVVQGCWDAMCGAPALWGYWAPMGDVRHMQRQSRGVGVGVSFLASLVVSRVVILARPVTVVFSP